MNESRRDHLCRLKRLRGFSLLEMIAAVVLLAVVSWVVIPRLTGNSLEPRQNACYVNKRDIEVQAELWYRNKGTWPASDLSDIGADPGYFPDGVATCRVDGTAYILDETTHHVVGHDHP